MNKLDIYNLAISRNGISTRIESLTENSTERQVCDQHYDFALNYLLSLPVSGWCFTYSLYEPTLLSYTDDQIFFSYPDNAVKILDVDRKYESGCHIDYDCNFASYGDRHKPRWQSSYFGNVKSIVINSGNLECYEDGIIVKYSRSNIPVENYPPYFIDAFVARLAYEISMALVKDPSGTNLLGQNAENQYLIAINIDQNQQYMGSLENWPKSLIDIM